MNLDANEMLIFAKVVQSGSITAASKILNQPKSTLSRKLASLEKRLGVRLLQRTTRKLRLTEIGTAYYQRVAAIATQMEEAEFAVGSMLTVPQGRLKITATAEFAVYYLSPLLRHFMDQYPKVSVHSEVTDRVVDLAGEDIDVAIRMGDLDESSLIARKLKTSKMQLVASPEYLKKHGAPKHPSDLQNHRTVHFTTAWPNPVWTLQGPEGARVEVPLNFKTSSNHLGMVRAAAIDSHGIALLPMFIIDDAIQAGHLVHILPDWGTEEAPISIVFVGQRLLLPKVRVFVDFLTDVFSKGCAARAFGCPTKS